MARERTNKGLTSLARNLRRRSTETEQILWRHPRARRLGPKFRRQMPLCGYVVDFVSFEQKLIIELDGSQHGEAKQHQKDFVRDGSLEEAGYRILRFRNEQIRYKLPGVLRQIRSLCEDDALPASIGPSTAND